MNNGGTRGENVRECVCGRRSGEGRGEMDPRARPPDLPLRSIASVYRKVMGSNFVLPSHSAFFSVTVSFSKITLTHTLNYSCLFQVMHSFASLSSRERTCALSPTFSFSTWLCQTCYPPCLEYQQYWPQRSPLTTGLLEISCAPRSG